MLLRRGDQGRSTQTIVGAACGWWGRSACVYRQLSRERILATASNLILQHGVTGVGIDDVPAAAGSAGHR
jgi:AcrR family transcriptional regulator